MRPSGYLVLDSGEVFPGHWRGGRERAGEVVFNTVHSGYEEVATDPSYYSQIMVFTAPMQGNYGVDKSRWESQRFWIEGVVCLQMQSSPRDSSWLESLTLSEVPVLSDVDTRNLVLRLRERGTPWGALVKTEHEDQARERAQFLMSAARQQQSSKDWAHTVSTPRPYEIEGLASSGPRVAVIDFGCKQNILRCLKKRCSLIKVFPSRSSAEEVRAFDPQGILLSNGPGDPKDVEVAVSTIRDLLAWRFIFGICMGHQLLAMALGAKTYRLKFGHRGGNHPIRDEVLDRIYVTSQNHGYAVERDSLPTGVKVTHTNLNDETVAGIFSSEKKCLGVQFHPESHPGPHDAEELFDFFIRQLR